MDLASQTAVQLRERLEQGSTKCVEILESVFSAIDRRESDIQAFLHLRDRDTLRAEARQVDDRRARGEPIGPLAGLPVAVKDSICTKGIPTTCASKMLGNFVPPYDATVVERITRADGIVVGKTNMDEFSMGSSTENSAYQITRNPHSLPHSAGGSSGGSAAAVAAHLALLAIGGDTGGSVRQPAAFCGVVGMKPTYGRVSRFGLIAYASSLDQIGVFGKDVTDAAQLLSVIAGHDARDATSLDEPIPDYATEAKVAGRLRIGVPQEYFVEGLDSEVRKSIENSLQLLRGAGHSIVDVSLPHTSYALPTYYIIACAEASSNLARYDGCQFGVRAPQFTDLIDMMSRTRMEGFGSEVKRRILLGTHILSAGYRDAFYIKALKVRRLLVTDFQRAFQSCDVLLHAVSPTPPFKLGEKTDNPLVMYLNDIFSVVANLAGLPAISLPCGWTAERLPVGVQLVAPWRQESLLFQAAYALERLLSAPPRG